MIEKLIEYDKSLFLWLNSHHSPAWDNIMFFISGKIEWIPLYLVLIWFIVHKFRWKSIPIFLAVIMAITLSDQLSVHAFKEVFHRLRPSHNPEFLEQIHLVNNYRGGPYGFISNHAANTFALATLLALVLRGRIFIVFIFVWAGLVSYSRIYIGVHYPADIIAGIAFGSFIGWLVYQIYLFSLKKLYPNNNSLNLPEKKRL